MNALTIVFAAICVFAIAYRFYGLFIARRVLGVDGARTTPAVALADGHDYHKTNRYVLFGHHFAAIAAAGPLLGPVLAAQFGYLPGALWIVVGCVLGGAVHDLVVLFASVRHGGRSLSLIAETEIGKTAGTVASFAILFILTLTLAGLSIAVVNAMAHSPWGTFTVVCTIPIALFMGLWLYKLRPGDVTGASVAGGVLLLGAILAGPYVAANPTLAALFTLSRGQIAIIIPLRRGLSRPPGDGAPAVGGRSGAADGVGGNTAKRMEGSPSEEEVRSGDGGGTELGGDGGERGARREHESDGESERRTAETEERSTGSNYIAPGGGERGRRGRNRARRSRPPLKTPATIAGAIRTNPRERVQYYKPLD